MKFRLSLGIMQKLQSLQGQVSRAEFNRASVRVEELNGSRRHAHRHGLAGVASRHAGLAHHPARRRLGPLDPHVHERLVAERLELLHGGGERIRRSRRTE